MTVRPGSSNGAVNHVARVLMAAWEEAEGKPVTPSYVATFVDMARAIIADNTPGEQSVPVQLTSEERYTIENAIARQYGAGPNPRRKSEVSGVPTRVTEAVEQIIFDRLQNRVQPVTNIEDDVQVEYAIRWAEKIGTHDDGYSRPNTDRQFLEQALADSAYDGGIVQHTVTTTPWVEVSSSTNSVHVNEDVQPETGALHKHKQVGRYPDCRGCGTYFCGRCDTYGDHASYEPHPRPVVETNVATGV